jgi:adenine-specific DNA-methyltransferase
LELPVLSDHETDVRVYRQEANRLAAELPELDVVYLDPPYNQHPYGSNYFMLNLLADYRPPANISRVSGVPTDWNRSAYNKRALAQESLFSLIDTVPTRYLLISYNAEGFISRAEMESKLRSIGRLDVLEIPYRTFRGSRNLRSRSLTVTEFLFVVERF